jgi:hypothetical protein
MRPRRITRNPLGQLGLLSAQHLHEGVLVMSSSIDSNVLRRSHIENHSADPTMPFPRAWVRGSWRSPQRGGSAARDELLDLIAFDPRGRDGGLISRERFRLRRRLENLEAAYRQKTRRNTQKHRGWSGSQVAEPMATRRPHIPLADARAAMRAPRCVTRADCICTVLHVSRARVYTLQRYGARGDLDVHAIPRFSAC